MHNFSVGSWHCFLCLFDGNQIFNLRGLCSEQDFVDTKYIFMHTLISQSQLTFRGLSGKSNISYDFANKTWIMVKHVQLEESKINIVGRTTSKYFPLGRKMWTLNTDCSNELVDGSKKQQLLKLSQVSNIFLTMRTSPVQFFQ